MNPWLEQFDYAIFDCDGVILDSNAIKTQAFREALPGEPENLVEQLVSFHKATGGVSRYVKLEYFFKELKREQHDAHCAELVNRALERFGSYCFDALVSCDEILGVQAILEAFNDRSIPTAVVSGAAQHELRQVFDARELTEKFIHVLGSPNTKIENMAWLENANFLKGEGVFFGDSKSDLDAARHYGLDFVFVSGRSEWVDGEARCRALGYRVVEDFLDFRGQVEGPRPESYEVRS